MSLLAASRYQNNDNKYNWKGASRAEKYLCSSIGTQKKGEKNVAKWKYDAICVRTLSKATHKNDDCYSSNQNAYIRLPYLQQEQWTSRWKKTKNGRYSQCVWIEVKRFYCFYLSDYRKRWSRENAQSNSTDKTRHGFVHIYLMQP